MNICDNLEVDDFICLDKSLFVLNKSIGINIYDFAFRTFFDASSVMSRPQKPVVARIGAIQNYESIYNKLKSIDVQLIHSPEEHKRCSILPEWYPIIEDLTPKSVIYNSLPSSKQVESDLGWPIFVKGERQTSQHKKSLSIIEGPKQFEELLKYWKNDNILNWQRMVCRQYVDLLKVDDSLFDRIPSSYEFRLFFWKSNLVGVGKYWFEGKDYELNKSDQNAAFPLGFEVAKRLDVNFLVVDIAKTIDGKWIVIEVNDGQESGYAGVVPYKMWQNIIQIEKGSPSPDF